MMGKAHAGGLRDFSRVSPSPLMRGAG